MAQEVKDTDTKQAIQELADTVKASADKTNTTLKSLSNKQTGTQKVKAAEEKSEREQAAKEERGIFIAIRDSLSGSFATFKDRDQKSGGILAGLFGGMGTGVGALGKSIAGIGIGFAKALAAIGAGIAGFMLALGGADVILGLMGADGGNLKTVIQNFFGAFDEKSAALMGGVILAAGLLAGFKVNKWEFAKAMAAIGAGIAGFMGGILVGEIVGGFALDAIGGLDGSALTTVLNNFFGSMTAETAAGLGVVVTIAGLLAKFKVEPTQLAKQMVVVAAGIVGFVGGILIGEAVAGFGMKLISGVDGSGLGVVMNNFFGAMTAEAQAGLGIVVTIAGLLAAFKVDPKVFAKAMAGVGAGIVGFSVGILMGDAIAKFGMEALGGIDGSSLATLMTNFFGAMTPEIATGLGIVVTIGGLIAKFKVPAAQMVIGMSALGAGIAGFSIGILLADGAAKLGAMAGLDGKSLKKLMGNFLGIFEGVGTAGLIALMVAVGAAALAPPAIIMGFTALGAGIAAFMGFLVAADWIAGFGTGENLKVLLTNVGQAIGGFIGGIGSGMVKQLEEIDAEKLSQLGLGIKDIGLGMLAFAGGQAGGVVSGAMESIAGFFGQDSPLDTIAELSKDKDIDAERLRIIGQGIAGLGMGMQAFAGVDAASVKSNIAALNSLKGVTIDDQQMALFEKSATLMKGSETMRQQGGVSPTIIVNNNDNSSLIQNASNQTVTLPDAVVKTTDG